MRIFDLEIDGRTYKACCGLMALSELQKKYGTLTRFEESLLGKSAESDDPTEDMPDDMAPDVDTVIYAAESFLKSGTDASDGTLSEEEIRKIVYTASDLFGMAAKLHHIFAVSLYAENQEDGEKN